jgi:DNA ligase-1
MKVDDEPEAIAMVKLGTNSQGKL